MGLYWRKSSKILPGVRINWSKSGPSVSVGPRGAKVNIGKRGTYVSGGISGTGLYYRQRVGGRKNCSNTSSSPSTLSSLGGANGIFTGKGCLISIILSIVLSLIMSGNFVTCILFTLTVVLSYGVYYLIIRRRLVTPTSSQQQSQAPLQNNAPSCQSQQTSNDIDIQVAVAEIEHLIAVIDNGTDKTKLPSYYRRLMSIIAKLEGVSNRVTIKGLPLDVAKKRIIENYRNKMK